MDTKFNYAVVGLFTISFTIAFFVMMIWLVVGISSKSYTHYSVFMKESVSGLAIKAPVKYNGVEIGYVNSITLCPTDPSKVRLMLSIERNIPITLSTRAKLENQGLTGIGYIELTGGKAHETRLKALPGEAYPTIPSEPSLMFRLDTALSHLSHNIDEITQGVQGIFNEQNIQNLHQMLANIQQIIQNVTRHTAQFEQLITDISTVFHNTAAASSDLPFMMHDLKTAARAINTMGQNMQATTEKINSAFANGSILLENINQQMLPEVSTMLTTIQAILGNLEGLSQQLDTNPAVWIRGTTPPKSGPGES